ncbi:hypothetical protein SDC9_83323 [bioreactor metagenome]|uniref:Uncharacterized protein n=1 Tax=bioreactor metagenome TaxID=1076179 RepID=A0A644Z9S8_9ZZZZ
MDGDSQRLIDDVALQFLAEVHRSDLFQQWDDIGQQIRYVGLFDSDHTCILKTFFKEREVPQKFMLLHTERMDFVAFNQPVIIQQMDDIVPLDA